VGWTWLALVVVCGLFEVYRIVWLGREIERRTAAWGKSLDGALSALRSEVKFRALTQSAMQQSLESMYAELREARKEVDRLREQRPPGSRGP
jgi:hypothetical protein